MSSSALGGISGRSGIPFEPLLRCYGCGDRIVQIRPGKWRCENTSGTCTSRQFQLRNIDIVCARKLVQWVRSIKDWDTLHREYRYQLADRVLALQADSADTKLKLRRLLDALENGARSIAIAERITELETHLIEIEAQLSELAHDPLPTVALLQLRLQRRTCDLLQQINTPRHRTASAAQVAAMLTRIDMHPGTPGHRASLQILPNLLYLARSAATPRPRIQNSTN